MSMVVFSLRWHRLCQSAALLLLVLRSSRGDKDDEARDFGRRRGMAMVGLSIILRIFAIAIWKADS
jgi:hypothetical protein